LKQLKERVEPLGLPFDPNRGKGTKGFKVGNIWIGDQYFEMPYLKNEDSGGWKKEWVEKYNKGKHGAYCLFIMTDELENEMKELKNKGVQIGEPELLGFLTKTLPWRSIYTRR
jgi:hypothetical protein